MVFVAAMQLSMAIFERLDWRRRKQPDSNICVFAEDAAGRMR